MSATWSTTSRTPSPSTPTTSAFGCAPTPRPRSPTWCAATCGCCSAAGRPMPDGRTPAPGGWNRIHFIVDDIVADVERLRAAGLTFRNDIVSGPGGHQILLEDPSGNPVELF